MREAEEDILVELKEKSKSKSILEMPKFSWITHYDPDHLMQKAHHE